MKLDSRWNCVWIAAVGFDGLRGVMAQDEGLVPMTFEPLPLGSIKPAGWLKDQLQLSADGLAGHEHDFYDYVAHSTWLGGTKEYSNLREGFPYWFNGLVPLAYLLDDSRLLDQVRSAADYVLGHQQDDGWLGPEKGNERNFWGRMPFFLGLMNMADADKTYERKIMDALWKSSGLMNSMLRDNYTGYHYHDGDKVGQGDEQWGRVRVQDMLITLQWMYEFHSDSHNATQLWETMDLLIKGSLNWADWYNAETYIKQDLNTLPVSITEPLFPYTHGVNVGQGLKAPAVFRRHTHNTSLIRTTQDAVSWTFQHHASASGAILADERLAGLAPYYGSETCTLVETMFSLSYLYQALGDNTYADLCEKIAYNAFPVQMSKDWWARQYVSQPNQPYSENLTKTPFWNVNSWGQTYGLETDYPCCTVNHGQGYPKFAAAMFVQVPDSGGHAHALLGPGSVTLDDGTSIACTTTYPFSNTLTYTITSPTALNFYMRIPAWTLPNSTLLFPSTNTSHPVSPDPYSGLHAVSLPPGPSTFSLTLSNPGIRVEQRANDTVAIHYGALVFALALPYIATSSPPKAYGGGGNEGLPEGYAPEEARDWVMRSEGEWRWGVDVRTLEVHYGGDMEGGEVWGKVWISGRGCEIEWGVLGGGDGEEGVPDVPPTGGERRCVGGVGEVRLEPLGGAKVHVLDIPVVELD
ncbi:hypothetical protein EJ04DRAFT_577334 [Polyplosphaeria fusca]|uniref:Non-reducing end beta-L-arabinofuranosidase-like GH127 catalytic domain-containing protein n=1 Tax=Polyplosphaeria fusca TaxID=682080 RepID=A0A9P4QZE4_9PLEO|nr:hypothetical protein EJ04DRAFT_577334 [Polyplosphaeria fusca]